MSWRYAGDRALVMPARGPHAACCVWDGGSIGLAGSATGLADGPGARRWPRTHGASDYLVSGLTGRFAVRYTVATSAADGRTWPTSAAAASSRRPTERPGPLRRRRPAAGTPCTTLAADVGGSQISARSPA